MCLKFIDMLREEIMKHLAVLLFVAKHFFYVFDFLACYHAYQQLTKSFESQGRINQTAKNRLRTVENSLQKYLCLE